METFELILLFTLIALALQFVADWLDIPLAIIQVSIGFILSFFTAIPDFKIDPNLAFTIFIPPLVYWGALNTSIQELTRQGLSVGLLALGLIFATIATVAVVLHGLMPQLPWAACCVVGAMVAPPDADIMTSVVDKLGLPIRVSSVLEGEALTNDAPALVSFRWSLAALMSGTFSFKNAIPSFLIVAIGAVVFGWVFARAILYLKSKLAKFEETSFETGLSIFSPFIVFIAAERLHLSGVLAVATLGFFVIKHSPSIMKAQARLQILTVWQSFIDLIGGFLFVLVGFISTRTFKTAMANGGASLLQPLAAIIATIIVVRLVWVIAEYRILPFVLPKRAEKELEGYSWKELLVISWSGMRGGDTLVAALALPLALPFRMEITTLALGVLMFTLLVEGLSLKYVIKALGIHRDYSLRDEVNQASEAITDFMLRQIERWRQNPRIANRVSPEAFENIQRAVCYRKTLDGKRNTESAKDGRIPEDKLELRLIRSAYRKLLKMRDNEEICDATMRTILRDLDLQTLRFAGRSDLQTGGV